VAPADDHDDREAEPTRASGSRGPEGSGLDPGATFGGHRIEAVAGTGGMGVVYRARNVVLDQVRALKLIAAELSDDRGFRERFRRESRLAASIEHPNLVPVHHAGEEAGRLYLTMRFVDGTDLGEVLADEGRLDPGRAARILDQVSAALDAAHAGGLVHRDVKPANVLLEGEPASEHAYLTDFGTSKLVTAGTELTTTGRFVGTVDYVAPEQIAGEGVDGRADVYSLACVAYHALAGEPPFRRETQIATMFAHSNAPRPRLSEHASGIPPALDDVLARGMAQKPDDRFESAGGLVDAMHAALGTTSVTAPRPPVRARDSTASTRTLPAPWRHGALSWVAGGVVAAAAIAAGFVLLLGGDDEASEPAPTARIAATIVVGDAPKGVTVGNGRAWVASTGAGAVDVIDPAHDRAGRPIPVDGNPAAVAVGFGSLWVADHSGGAVVRVPVDGGGASAIEVGEKPSDVAVDGDWVWVANEGSDTVSRIDPGAERVETIAVGDGPRSLATADGAVWVTNIEGASVTKIDPDTAKRVGTPIELGERPNDVAVGAGAVWVTDVFNGTLSRIDPGAGEVVAETRVGSNPRGVKTGFGYVWVANGGDDELARVDPETTRPGGDPVAVGNDPADAAATPRTASATATPAAWTREVAARTGIGVVVAAMRRT
jgi:YVTN family beta-propeller protein